MGFRTNVAQLPWRAPRIRIPPRPQFFINVEINKNLDHTGTTDSHAWGYAVFGRVTEGMDTVDDIRLVATNARDTPLETVTIESVEIH